MARKVSVDWAPADTAAALHAQYRAEPVAEVRTRLHALWLLRRGEGPTAVAAVVGVGRNAVQRWLRWYRAGGLEAVRSHRRGGPGKPSFLTRDQARQLVAEAASGGLRRPRRCGTGWRPSSGWSTAWAACTRCCRGWGSG